MKKKNEKKITKIIVRLTRDRKEKAVFQWVWSKLWLPELFDVVLMWDTFGQDPRRSIFERFHLFMNCCNVFFHVILDWKLNVSKLAESLAARIVWCCATVGHFWPRSVTFNVWVSFSILLQEIQKEDWKLNLSDTAKQDFLNGSVKDCLEQSYTDRFKTKRRFITKNANVAKLDSFIYCNP